MVNYARQKGLFVEVTFFAPFQGGYISTGSWIKNTTTHRSRATVNGTLTDVGFSDPRYFVLLNGNSSDANIPASQQAMSTYQKKVIDAVVDALWCFDQVYWEIANEPDGGWNGQGVDPGYVADWEKQMVNEVRTRERTHPLLLHGHLIAVQPFTSVGAAAFLPPSGPPPAQPLNLPAQILNGHYTTVKSSNRGNLPFGTSGLDVNLDLAPAVPNPIQPAMPLRITDRRAAGAGQSDRAGRSLAADALLDACHAEVSDFDLKVYSILARTLRVSDCLLQPTSHCDGGRFRFKSVFFRGALPLTYRVNVFSYSVSCDDAGHCFYGEGQVALLLHVQVDAGGRLAGGDIQALPWCTGADSTGCTSLVNPDFAAFILPPLRPGLDRQSEADFARAAHLNLEFRGSENNVLAAQVNWTDLLRGSSWNESSGNSP